MADRRKRYLPFFGSDRLRGRQARRRAKHDLRNGREPQPRYVTGKYWDD